MSVSVKSTDTQAQSSLDSGASSSESALRDALSAFVLSARPAAAKSPVKTILAANGENLSCRAAIYALENFRTLVTEGQSSISEERLYELLRYGRHDASVTALLSYLHRQIKHVGHAVGTRESRTCVAAGGFAMPITFTVTVYAIDALDLIETICAGTGSSE
jgi:hypothetical protein